MRITQKITWTLLLSLLSNPLAAQQPASNSKSPWTAEEVRYISRPAEIVARLERDGGDRKGT